MDDKILALLGDRAAQERITERGELLPCQCGGNAELVFQKRGSLLFYKYDLYTVECKKCGMVSNVYIGNETAIRNWNTRAPILSVKELEGLKSDSNTKGCKYAVCERDGKAYEAR